MASSWHERSTAEARCNNTPLRTATEVAQPISTITLAEVTLSDARDLAMRVNRLVDRIVGSDLKAGRDEESLVADGILPSLREACRYTSSALSDARHALDRLERELP